MPTLPSVACAGHDHRGCACLGPHPAVCKSVRVVVLPQSTVVLVPFLILGCFLVLSVGGRLELQEALDGAPKTFETVVAPGISIGVPPQGFPLVRLANLVVAT